MYEITVWKSSFLTEQLSRSISQFGHLTLKRLYEIPAVHFCSVSKSIGFVGRHGFSKIKSSGFLSSFIENLNF